MLDSARDPKLVQKRAVRDVNSLVRGGTKTGPGYRWQCDPGFDFANDDRQSVI